MPSVTHVEATPEFAGVSPAVSDHAVIPVNTLLGAAREAILLHDGVYYRLRITANNKLILTK